MDLYHGTAKAFDQFDQNRIVVSSGDGAIENGRGTYFTSDRAHADRWSGRNSKQGEEDLQATLRTTIEDATWKNNFIRHEQTFTKAESIRLAVAAADGGFHETADHIARAIRREGAELTGKNIADITRSCVESVHFLSSLGYAGFAYDGSSNIVNAVFLDAKQIPETIPVLTGWTPLKQANAAGIAAGDIALPTGLEQATTKLLQKMDTAGQSSGIEAQKIDEMKERITNLSKAAAAMEGYDAQKQSHPLKLAELSTVVAGGDTIAKALRSDINDYVKTGMEALGHGVRPSVLQLEPPVIPALKGSNGYDHAAMQHFAKRLDDTSYVASEELRTARQEIKSAHPDFLVKLDRLIDDTHAPALASSGFSIRDSVGHALRGILRGEITPAEAVKKIDSACGYAPCDTKSISDGLRSIAAEISYAKQQTATPKVQMTAKISTSSFMR